MRGLAAILFAAATLVSPWAIASTELSAGSSGILRSAPESVASTFRDDMEAQDALSARFPAWLSSPEESATDDFASAVERALRDAAGASAPASAGRDPFGWVFLLIAFAGLTAVFAGRRSGGRGLISG